MELLRPIRGVINLGMKVFQRREVAGCLAAVVLIAGIWLVYWPVSGFGFVNLDDPVYVTENAHVQAGITWQNLKWSWQAFVACNWHPLTLISHMLDCQWYGLNASGHHVDNVVLHTLNSLLVFYLMRKMTRRVAAAFCVAALFAWHPCHVESVAWISERKDVLSTFFGLLAILAYVWFAENAPEKPSWRLKSYYLLSILLFALGLAAKPMLVTLPFVLLLLDYWPLQRVGSINYGPAGRFRRASLARLALEKAPFILLAILSCGVTLWAQHAGGAIATITSVPMTVRIANAVTSYYRYVGKMFWPMDLAVIYPLAPLRLTWVFWLASSGLFAITAAALRLRKFQYVTVGWLWFVGTLVPVIGLVQVGVQAMADRYTYFPSIGLFILAVFGIDQIARRFRYGVAGLLALAILALTGCLATASHQVRYWRDSETLFRHAVDVTKNNFLAYNRLGEALENRGRLEAAMECFRNSTLALPQYADAHCNLGYCFWKRKQSREAYSEYQSALELEPNNAKAHYYLGNLLLRQGNVDGAIEHYKAALSTTPDHADLHYQLATALVERGDIDEGGRQYRDAIKLHPDWVEALNNLSWLLATQPEARFRDGKEAVQFALRAVTLTQTNDPGMLDTLAAAYAENAEFSAAEQAAGRAVTLARSRGKGALASEIEGRLQLYQNSQPFRQSNAVVRQH